MSLTAVRSIYHLEMYAKKKIAVWRQTNTNRFFLSFYCSSHLKAQCMACLHRTRAKNKFDKTYYSQINLPIFDSSSISAAGDSLGSLHSNT